jgi:hypothetical protein
MQIIPQKIVSVTLGIDDHIADGVTQLSTVITNN